MSKQFHPDTAIRHPDDDRYGIREFAEQIAKGIAESCPSEGFTIGLHGKWGVGKTSTVNLVRYYLKDPVEAGEIEIVYFNPWWVKGEDLLALSFLTRLKASLKSLDDKVEDIMDQMAKNAFGISKFGGWIVTGLTANLVVGKISEKGFNWLLKQGAKKELTTEKLAEKLAEILSNQSKRFLIIIDDIDRLTGKEAKQVFRLIKTLGHLPNIVYLLVFDRDFTNRIYKENRKDEGPDFIEKIIQVHFDVPAPQKEDIKTNAIEFFKAIFWPPEENERIDENVLIELGSQYDKHLAPLLKTHRDLVRFANALTITASTIKDEVNTLDFIVIEALRTFEPKLYNIIWEERDLLVGVNTQSYMREDHSGEYDEAFLNRITGDKKRERFKELLMEMFPRTEGIWSNIEHSDHSLFQWQTQRRICSPNHFNTYFKFSISEDAIPKTEIQSFIDNLENQQETVDFLISQVNKKRKNTRSFIPVLFNELKGRKNELTPEKTILLLKAVFSAHDDLSIPEDAGLFENNTLEIHWLVNVLLESMDIAKRTEILKEAMKEATLTWFVSFAARCLKEHDKDEARKAEENRLVTPEVAQEFGKTALAQIEASAEEGSLIDLEDVSEILFRWADFAEGSEPVIRWTNEQIEKEETLLKLLRGIDHPKGSNQFRVTGYQTILDLKKIKPKIKAIVTSKILPQDDLETYEGFRAHLERTKQKAPEV